MNELFSQAISLEDNSPEEALVVYARLLKDDPDHVAAHINIGTLYFNRNDFKKAHDHYLIAVGLDKNYALAHFDLANTFDELGHLNEAIAHYERAIAISPTYADAHYNLAITLEKTGQHTKAMRHWQAYKKLDTSSMWTSHAKARIKTITGRSNLFLIRDNSRPRRTKRRAALCLASS